MKWYIDAASGYEQDVINFAKKHNLKLEKIKDADPRFPFLTHKDFEVEIDSIDALLSKLDRDEKIIIYPLFVGRQHLLTIYNDWVE